MRGAELLIECLRDQDVDTIFGYPGGAVIDIYDALAGSDIQHILARHEQAAVHAADGYARALNKTGVCFATAGPGATNLVTGIATAYMDSSPLVIITGQVAQSQLGSDAFQEADITGITMPVTKHSYLVQDIKELPRIIKEAFHIASTGRPQPVLVDITKDVLKAEISKNEVHLDEITVDLVGYKPVYKGHPLQVKKATRMLENAEKPVIIAGGGVKQAQASDELLEIAEQLKIPVATTLMGLAEFPHDHNLSLGMMGMHGTVTANMTVSEADVVLAVGVRFSDRTFGSFDKFKEGKQLIHIDIDPAEIDKNVKADLPIVGDAKNILNGIIKKVSEKRTQTWYQEICPPWRSEDKKISSGHTGLSPQRVVKCISDKLKDKAVDNCFVTTDVGQHQMWVAQYFDHLKAGRFITSGGLGAMGFGFPSAIGAKLARPEHEVISFVGDGSFQMTMQELALLKIYNLPIKIVIINNGCLGMVRQWQELFYNKNYSQIELDENPDFAALASAYGIEGITLENHCELEDTVDKIVNSKRPLLVEVKVCTQENVYPFVPPGKPITEIIKEGL